jgi:hypothetical protein
MGVELDARKTGTIDMEGFKRYVSHYAHLPECCKDELAEGKCHLMTELRDFTVCEE